MRRLLVHVLVFALVFGFPGALTAGNYKWIGQGGEKKWNSHAEFTGHVATDSIYGGEISPFIPIAQDDISMWFVNVRNNLFWEHGDFGHEFNIGGGYRRLMGDSSWIIGGYGFFDRMESRYDNYFNQGTIGMEAMAVDWDARINGYIASDDEKNASAATAAKAMFSGGTIKVKSGIEQAMSGFDAELGWRLPFDLDSIMGDTRVYAGGFYFDANQSTSIAGPKLRAEMRVHDIPGLWEGSRVTLSSSYRWDDERGSDVRGMLSLRIPIGAPTRTAPLTHLERRMTDSVVRDVFIVTDTGLGRAQAALSQTGVEIGDALFFDESTFGVGTEGDPGEIGAMIAAGGENALLIGLDTTGDVEVDNETLLDGQTVAGGGSELVVFAKNSGDRATVRLPGIDSARINNDGETAFHLAENNTIAGLTFLEDIDRALELELSDQSTSVSLYQNYFMGLNTAFEVDVEDDSSLQLWMTDNLFDSVDTGLDLWASDSFDIKLEVHDNRFRNDCCGAFGPVGMDLRLTPDGGSGLPSSFALNASGNEFDSLGSGIETYVDVSGDQDYTHTTRIWNNTFVDNSYDDYALTIVGDSPDGDVVIDVELRDNFSESGYSFADIDIDPIPYGSINIAIVGNYIDHTSGSAIEIDTDDTSEVHIAVTDNALFDTYEVNDAGAIDIDVDDARGGSGNTIDVSRNSIFEVNDDGDAIRIQVDDSYDTAITVNDNDIREIDDGSGISIYLDDTGHEDGNTVMVTGNTIAEIDDDGIYVEVDSGFATELTISNNAIRDVDDDGIEVDFQYCGDNGTGDGCVATIENNTIGGEGDDGIDVYFGYGYDGTLTIANNTISDFSSAGIDVELTANGHTDAGNVVTIDNNTISNIGSDGVYVDFNYNSDSTLTISNNTISDIDDGNAIDVDFYGNGHSVGDVVKIENNTVSDTSSTAINLYFGSGFDVTLDVADNTVTDSGGDGIEVDFYANGITSSTVTIKDNTITNVDDDGIDVVSDYSYDLTLEIAKNSVDDAGDDGIQVEVANSADGSVGSTVEITDNTVNRVDDDGIDVYFYNSADGTLKIDGNTITNAGLADSGNGNGIEVDFYYAGHGVGNVAIISNNTIDHVSDDGIDFDADYSRDTRVTISDNVINDTDDDGIDVYFYGNGHDLGNTAWISGNAISKAGDNGIEFADYYSYDLSLTIFENNIDGARGDGIHVELDETGDGGGNVVAIANNTVTDAMGNGIYTDVYDSYITAVTITDNAISGSGVNGIEANFDYQYDSSMTVSENNISDSGHNGVYLNLYYSDDNTIAITDNHIDESGDGIGFDNGIYVWSGDDSDGNSHEIGGNTVDDSDDYGIYVYSYEDTTSLSSVSGDNKVGTNGDGASGFDGVFTGTISVNGVLVP